MNYVIDRKKELDIFNAPFCPIHRMPEDGKILVIDDTQSVRNLIKIMLNSRGYDVMTAQNGSEGYYLFKQHAGEIGLLISDIDMPMMDGIEFYGKIREIKPNQPIIFISGNFQGRQTELQKFDAVKGLISKPFDLDEILDLVKEAISA